MKEERFALTAPEPKAGNFLEVLERVAATPGMSVDVIERMLAVQERLIADQRKTEFTAALSRLQAKVPHVEKNGKILNKDGSLRNKYSLYEDIDTVVRPMLSDEELAIAFDTESTDAKIYRIIATLSHRNGYSESKSVLLPVDNSPFRTAVQNVSSTISQGRRTLLKLWLNIVEKGDDNPEIVTPITADQAKDLDTMIIDVGADKKRFLQYMGVATVEEILLSDLTKAITALNAKRTKK